jgi:hypothetical protein
MVEASVTSDVELLQNAFEERTGIFARDAVLISEAVQFVHKHSPAKPNAHRVARVLNRPPFNGTTHQFRVGESRYRCVVLRNKDHWIGVSGKNLMGHIQGDDFDVDLLS